MAKYKAYPEYKDSGVELLGEVPLTWRVFKLKFGLSEPLVYGANEAALDDNPDNPRYIRITDMNPDGTLRNDTFKSLPKVISEPYMLIDGDILLARSGATVGKSFYYKSIFGPSCFAGYLIRARFDGDKIVPRLAYWFFQSSIYWQYVSGSQIQATIQNVSAEKYSDLYLSAPLGYAEQALIADFLDHETAKIDNLIEKQQQLIELLKEKRQAVISHAVTKGLNPDVPMKDSGVRWLGEVPAHWIKQKLVNVSEGSRGSFVNGPFGSDLLAEELRDHGVPVVYIRDIKPTGYSRKSTVFVTPMKAKQLDVCKLEPGNVVVSKVGDPPGDACVYPVGEPSAIITQDVIRIRVNMAQFSPEFIVYLLNSDFGRMVVNDISVEGTRKRVSLGDFKSTRFVFPPLKESLDIVRYLNSECEKLSCTIAKATQAVAFMQERRTALISAAVTGKIDVRDWVAPDTQDIEEPQEAAA
ncbi:TPA: restriction endonuclease subunit S [Klebsiella pneumoniae]|uniref:Restriction endonuclease subunit S n=2 Tax=Enterobacteriaceae TaxID=543 RepID=A0AAE7KX88_CITFR|nr:MULTISPECIES: hypothetical protein [Enterobacteriaceae]EKM8121184.1 restriction endonuclease subunit S [Enterobacter hormaechei]OFU87321.1 hypothetical protein HMPREF3111_07830 [Proteus sp. HMSC10D02]QLW87909.1 restriction endonuclease subunit S [Klebsiella oxytoca]GJK46589.1 restriction modification system DNA specificity domain-containing protein [Enterobacter cloacae]HED4047429.1 restriction endonuclease subunit S [Klebsiella variicola subsp. variicola]